MVIACTLDARTGAWFVRVIVLTSRNRLFRFHCGLTLRLGAIVEHIVPIYRGANNINMLINILSIFRGQPPEGGGFGGFVANMLINI